MDSMPCLCCLGRDTVALKLDKKGRPYSTCWSCGSRIFMRGRRGLRGLSVLAPTLVQVWETMVRDCGGDAQSVEERTDQAAREMVEALGGTA